MGLRDPGKREALMSFETACTIAQLQESVSNGPCPVHGATPNCGWPANDCECSLNAEGRGHWSACWLYVPSPHVHTGFECGAL